MKSSNPLCRFLERIGSESHDINERGNAVHRYSGCLLELDRYAFDFQLCKPEYGWQQYDTSQDAWYFGVWVNVAERLTFTYAEGDMTLVNCPTVESFRAELADMARFYGDPPPAAIGIDQDGTVTEYYDERPAVDG